ncbi:MAG: histidine kinase [Clostridia bacterium]|nr:histidine kinase [Clostridia bacterium]
MREEFIVNLSPHFVYNALNSAITLCRNCNKEAVDFLLAFSECLHYASMAKGTTKTLIQDEINFIKAYLLIESVRFSNRLTVHYDIDENINYLIDTYSIYSIIADILSKDLHQSDGKLGLFISIKKQYEKVIISVKSNDTHYVKLI